ncbi:carboxymuconolactone decarboxylase family protein [Variovorax sp. KK3]|uniref:carboxymuconolactone decarboxylase family protein n=1 Tax=Variovorax sp. KK3 TaxID=1855728 RepID=UPI00097C6907|nr:carboxymuconolactone decarboxylase family protein [Variovorax sp. KK3]
MKSDTYERGMKVRREMLGDAYVDQAMQSADALTQPFQDLAVEYCFGAIWAREDLPRRTRSLVNIGMLIALNRAHEFEVHLNMALSNGCTKAEIREVLLQATVYCGMPAGSQSFRIAKKVFAEHPDAP